MPQVVYPKRIGRCYHRKNRVLGSQFLFLGHKEKALATPRLAPIEYRTLNDIVSDQLRTAILSGQLPPGTALNQRDIADQLSVSRMPVREAFRVLEIEGLIRGLPRRKAVVVALQPEDAADIFDILATLEARGAERAAATVDDRAVARLRELDAELRACPDDPSRLLDLDLELHVGVYLAPSSRLRLLIQTHRNAVRPFMASTGLAVERRRLADAEHAAIVAALAARDAAAAGEAVAAHVHAEGRALVDRLRELRTSEQSGLSS
jgi:DNA-binding GntR family transcriptional regulator